MQVGRQRQILVEPVDQQDEPAFLPGAALAGPVEEIQEQGVPLRFGDRRRRLVEQFGELLDDELGERDPAVLLGRLAEMKNGTTRTPAGGRSANQDSSAVLPAQAGACHMTYCPAVPVANAARSASSPSRPSRVCGAIRSTWCRYVDRAGPAAWK
ncbi:hypothetical protein ACQEVZ_48875 [Dactylosporangium sp. CA-152071]|uniref:hypothetical protein n=1 Tax=Dactylosporangium sp. CA-152071 TaxID=3239933 RepID=UPI003D8F3FE6